MKILYVECSALLYLMRFTFIQFLIAVLTACILYASPINGQTVLDKRISIDFRDLSVEEVLKHIEKSTGARIVYSNNLFDGALPVKLSVTDISLDQLLSTVLSPYQVVFEVIEKDNIVLRKKQAAEGTSGTKLLDAGTNVQERSIKGKVTDNEGIGLPGVTVKLEGALSQAGVTDVNGNYSFNNLPSGNYTLSFSYLGFARLNREVNLTEGRVKELNVTLTAEPSSLQEVVVVGYGTQRRKDLTGAVSSVSAEEITDLPVVNAATALQGRAAGVNVVENSGRPGASATVQIRGVGTVGNSEPLYVIDGQITNSISNLNPNDIATIDILKDAASGAIYGARAANGVVLITTKRGTGGKTKFSLNSYFGPQLINRDQVQFMNAEEFVRTQNEETSFLGQPSRWTNPPEYYRDKSTDFWGKAWRTGFISNHNLSVSGGNDFSTFLISGGYLKNEGVQIGQDYQRFTLRLNSDHKLGKKIKLGQSLQVARANERIIGGAGQFNFLMTAASQIAPTVFPEKLSDGSWNGPTLPGEAPSRTNVNPLQIIESWDDEDKIWQILGSVYGEYEFIEGLKFRSSLYGVYDAVNGFSWSPQLKAGNVSTDPTSLDKNFREHINWQWDNTVSYNHTFAQKHDLSLLAGITAQEDKNDYLNNSIANFLDPSVVSIGGGDPTSLRGSGGLNDWALNSYIGRINYAFADKYLFQANLRVDGSSRFGANNRWGTFPSFSAGWRIAQENFMQNIPVISDLKLRGSWGKLGNDQVGLYPFAASLNLGQGYTFGRNQTIVQGAAPLGLANPDIRWEETTQTNIGIDLGLLENKISITADYFYKKTSDMLLQVPIPGSAGYTSPPFGATDGGAPFVNAGEVENKGLELMAAYHKTSGDFTWDLSFNTSFIKNKILALGKGRRVILNNDAVADIGTEVFAWYGYTAEGLYQNQAEIDAVNALNPTRAYDPGAGPGAIRFKDLNGDGLITNADIGVIGSPYPDFSGGINFAARYKGFDFTMFFQGVYGNDILSSSNNNYTMQPGGTQNKSKINANRWNGEGSTNDPFLWGVNGLNNASGGRDGRVSSAQLFDGSYLRAKNIQLGYSIPQKITSKMGVTGLRLYISSKNMFTIWNQKEAKDVFWDPELGTEGVGFGRYNLSSTPQPRTVFFGINMDL